jgi:hypothetical protein
MTDHPTIYYGVPPWAKVLIDRLDLILANQEKIMHTLDETLATVTSEKTDIGSVKALLDGLRQQLADALSGTTLPAPVQAKVDAIFDAAVANKADIATALAANVPTP